MAEVPGSILTGGNIFLLEFFVFSSKAYEEFCQFRLVSENPEWKLFSLNSAASICLCLRAQLIVSCKNLQEIL